MMFSCNLMRCEHMFNFFSVFTTSSKSLLMMVYYYNYCDSGHYRSSSFYIKHNVLETEFCLRLQVEPTQFGSIDRTSPYLQTPAPTQKKKDI
jgi:hypothetical protein